MTFSEDWFTQHIGVWSAVLKRFQGVECAALEIGSFEGRSACWLLQNILTHERSRITCIDTFEGSEEHTDVQKKNLFERFSANVAHAGSKVRVRRGESGTILKTLEDHSFDFIYVDGSHLGCDVLEDAVLSFRLLKVGGVMIFDDYMGGEGELFSIRQPHVAIECFIRIYAERLRVIHVGYQLTLVKTK